ncbi:808_t:CDS:2 [Ambispora gerdemannii]|uniref:808_t:CDS:1 n=1 Tax=Ambispora gerdemannii TaxID=144530 RepID=A0A9N8WKG3_9GLOM|nr:808_t:CDS:2 [Ambispora gerdemannii]
MRREPNSAVVLHARLRHDLSVDIQDLAREDTKEEHWQDKEHIVYPPALIVIIIEFLTDWEEHGATDKSHKKLQKDTRGRDDMLN